MIKDYAIVIGRKDIQKEDKDESYLTLRMCRKHPDIRFTNFEFYVCGLPNPSVYDCCMIGDIIEYGYEVKKDENQNTCITYKFLKNISHERRSTSFEKAYKKIIPLYTKIDSITGYICQCTGNSCKIATNHFERLHDTMEQSVKDGRTFITKECNLCAENECPIWYNTIYQIIEFAKQNSK